MNPVLREYSFIEENKITEKAGRWFVKKATRDKGLAGKATRALGVAHGAADTWVTMQAPFVLPAPDITAVKRLTRAVGAVVPHKSEQAQIAARRKAAVATGRFIRHPVKSTARLAKRMVATDQYTTGFDMDPNAAVAGIAGTAKYLNAAGHVYGYKAAEAAKHAKENIKSAYQTSKSAIGNWLDRVQNGVRDTIDGLAVRRAQLNPMYMPA